MNSSARTIAEAALTAVVTADPTVTPERVKNALAALDGVTAADIGLARSEPPPRILAPEVVAELMHVSTRSLRTYARRGDICRAHIGGKNQRAHGYWEDSVRDFLKRQHDKQVADDKHTNGPEVIEN